MSSGRHVTPGSEWAYRDVLIALFVTFLSLAALAIILVPKAKENLNSGKMLVQLYWDNTKDADVDLWVQGPNDHPVGYSSRTGEVFDLLHDHRGFHTEGDYSNTEFAIARHLPPGKYTINATLYQSWDHQLPIHIWVIGQLLGAGVPAQIFKEEAFLKAEKEEITLLNFRIDEFGQVIPESMNKLQEKLWKSQ